MITESKCLSCGEIKLAGSNEHGIGLYYGSLFDFICKLQGKLLDKLD